MGKMDYDKLIRKVAHNARLPNEDECIDLLLHFLRSKIKNSDEKMVIARIELRFNKYQEVKKP
jgi:hypothetical protein